MGKMGGRFKVDGGKGTKRRTLSGAATETVENWRRVGPGISHSSTDSHRLATICSECLVLLFKPFGPTLVKKTTSFADLEILIIPAVSASASSSVPSTCGSEHGSKEPIERIPISISLQIFDAMSSTNVSITGALVLGLNIRMYICTAAAVVWLGTLTPQQENFPLTSSEADVMVPFEPRRLGSYCAIQRV
ncbi:hypothetical protein BGX38DRAFT_1261801 [Terfezia claveryi]|nr:hypothetical protein BGX38DRAFT_1261801 [Terfezia claveryi]